MIYTVTFFNPIGNCDNITHVEADNEVDAALIAHADFWVTSKPFNLSDYKIENYDMKNLLTANLIYNDTTDMIDNDKSIYVLEEVPYQILNFFNITEEMLVNDSLEIKKLCQLTSI